jgi:anthranilate/para-aminobenzoate synthase component I
MQEQRYIAKVAVQPLEPAPDPGDVLVGLGIAQRDGEPLEPFLLAGDFALTGDPSLPLVLVGARPVSRFVPTSGGAEGGDRDFPWQPGATSLLADTADFVGEGGEEPVSLGGVQAPLSGGIVVGWLGHELGATRLARHETVLAFNAAEGSAFVVAAPRRGLSLGAATREAHDRARRSVDEFARAAGKGRRANSVEGARPPQMKISLPVTARQHASRIRTILEEIAAGEVYQVNLAHAIRLTPAAGDPLERARLFLSLWRANPVPYPAFVTVGDTTVLALSPERYLARRGERLESGPIKGTRPRGRDVKSDARLIHELRTSPKDRAENIMIVDLVRNDLGRLARPGSVQAREICRVSSLASVHHLVSRVEARLRRGVSLGEILAATHPPGSMTGAPKMRAVEILTRLEGQPRGPYAGGVGWFAGAAHFHLAMIIRSLVHGPTGTVLPVGGGVVADSDPTDEYRETLHKARSLLRVLTAPRAMRAGRRPPRVEAR